MIVIFKLAHFARHTLLPLCLSFRSGVDVFLCMCVILTNVTALVLVVKICKCDSFKVYLKHEETFHQIVGFDKVVIDCSWY